MTQVTSHSLVYTYAHRLTRDLGKQKHWSRKIVGKFSAKMESHLFFFVLDLCNEKLPSVSLLGWSRGGPAQECPTYPLPHREMHPSRIRAAGCEEPLGGISPQPQFVWPVPLKQKLL